MDPVRLRCQSVTKTKGKTHEVVQFYAVVGGDMKLGTPSLQITSDAGEDLFGKFVPGREFFLVIDEVPAKEDAKPVETKTEEEETTVITEADVVADRPKPPVDAPTIEEETKPAS